MLLFFTHTAVPASTAWHFRIRPARLKRWHRFCRGTTRMDTLIDKCPSWGYLVLIVGAFATAVVLSGLGMKAIGHVAARARRSESSR